MKKLHIVQPSALFPFLLIVQVLEAQNPLITDQFTADPSARVFEGKIYVYPSHDVPCGPGQGFIGFCMPDYHVFSSENLTEWTDHGVIVSQDRVEWEDPARYSLWAPDCIEKDGKYYFYFPAVGKDTAKHQGMRVGVAVSDRPYGPFIPEPEPIEGISGIDPNLFIDEDGNIRKVIPTFRGVGITEAGQEIHTDRYSAISKKGASIEFLDSLNRQAGWVTVLADKKAWIRYNRVDFGDKEYRKVRLKVVSESGGKIELHLVGIEKDQTLEAVIEPGENWHILSLDLEEAPKGMNDLVIRQNTTGSIRIDWLRFE